MKKPWTIDEYRMLEEWFPHMHTKEIAQRIGRNYGSVASKAFQMGLRKSPKIIQNCRFQPGHKPSGKLFLKGQEPWNKGIHFVAGGRSAQARFQPGRLPHNTLYDGAIVSRKDKSGKNYQYIRIANKKWISLQRYVWEQHYGKIPQGMIVAFKNRDTMDVRPENLELIDRKEHMRRNSIQRYPKELKQTIVILSKLKKRINEKQDN